MHIKMRNPFVRTNVVTLFKGQQSEDLFLHILRKELPHKLVFSRFIQTLKQHSPKRVFVFRSFSFLASTHRRPRLVRKSAPRYFSFAYSELAAMRMGTSGSASFQRSRKSL